MRGAARWISRLSHPFVLPVPTLVLALVLDGGSPARALAWAAICVSIAILPPTVLLVAQRRRRGDRDWYVTVREERFGLYGLGIACLATLLAVAWLGGAPALLLPSLAAAIAAAAIGAASNRWTKVSVHVGVATGCAILLGHVAPGTGPIGAASVAAVAWSRLQLGHHTPSQVVLGASIAAIPLLMSLAAFAQ